MVLRWCPRRLIAPRNNVQLHQGWSLRPRRALRSRLNNGVNWKQKGRKIRPSCKIRCRGYAPWQYGTIMEWGIKAQIAFRPQWIKNISTNLFSNHLNTWGWTGSAILGPARHVLWKLHHARMKIGLGYSSGRKKEKRECGSLGFRLKTSRKTAREEGLDKSLRRRLSVTSTRCPCLGRMKIRSLRKILYKHL